VSDATTPDGPVIEPLEDHPGEPDGFQRLWTPHRMVYIDGQDKPADATSTECPFCRVQSGSDEAGLIVARGTAVFAILNLYPYNSGHLMLLPYRHVSDYSELTPEETVELATMTKVALAALRATYAPQGFNLGTNLGVAAGAGIAAHLHQHVVPRWGGDANFLPVVGHTKALPELLADTRARLASAWPRAADDVRADGSGPNREGGVRA
jgi:ATP adenylyltransferase